MIRHVEMPMMVICKGRSYISSSFGLHRHCLHRFCDLLSSSPTFLQPLNLLGPEAQRELTSLKGGEGSGYKQNNKMYPSSLPEAKKNL